MKRWPDNMNYRVLADGRYFHTQRGTELLALLEHTDAYFHENEHWDEGAIAQLSEACLDCGLFEQAVKYYGELIPLCKRTQPNRGIGEGTLSGYCSQLARAYAGLGKTAEAVDAACEAIVSWGPRQEQRQEAIEALSRSCARQRTSSNTCRRWIANRRKRAATSRSSAKHWGSCLRRSSNGPRRPCN